jgi:serine/threonine-protein kinase RsbW
VPPAVKVVVPAKPDYVRVLRAVSASLAARIDFTYDRIQDLQLAVTEACATLLNLPSAADVMVMRVSELDGRVSVTVCTNATSTWPPPDVEETLAWRVLSGLTDQAAFEMVEDGPAVRIEFGGGPR